MAEEILEGAVRLTLPLTRYGGSLGLTIPKRTLERIGYKEGDLVHIIIPLEKIIKEKPSK